MQLLFLNRYSKNISLAAMSCKRRKLALLSTKETSSTYTYVPISASDARKEEFFVPTAETLKIIKTIKE